MTTPPGEGERALTLSDFDFDLPEERIALRPADPRDAARLLCVVPGAGAPCAGSSFSDHSFSDLTFLDLPGLLQPGDLLVFNDTKVIPARLIGTRIRDENRLAMEALLLERLDDAHWRAFAKPGKRLRIGDRLAFGGTNRACALAELWGTITAKAEDGTITIGFERAGAFLDEAIALVGAMPLPPYILEARKRLGDANSGQDFAGRDAADYQTMFAARDGAIAAPTASLHFTPRLMAQLAARGVAHAFVTLHVGAGTFLPVKSDDLETHQMHAEWGEISAEAANAINAARAAGGRVIAAGTTAARLLESAATPAGIVQPFLGETAIFIRPGYRFRAVDALITNFHLPKSTLLMLVSAFSGVKTMRAAYAHAIKAGYRFYSYGDASLLWPAQEQA